MELGEGLTTVEFRNDHLLPTSTPTLLALSNERLLVGGLESKTYLADLSQERWSTYPGLNYNCEDQAGTEWFLSHDGRLVSRDVTGICLAYGVSDGLMERPNRIFCSSDGTVWASGQNNGVAAIAYLKNGDWVTEEFPELGFIISHLGVFESSEGAVIFGSGTPSDLIAGVLGGAVEAWKTGVGWNLSLKTPPEYPKRSAVMVERAKGEVWIGGDVLMRNDAGVFREVDLFGARRWIDHLAIDSRRNLWAAAWGSGVHRFDGEGWVTFTEGEGLASKQVIHLLAGKS